MASATKAKPKKPLGRLASAAQMAMFALSMRQPQIDHAEREAKRKAEQAQRELCADCGAKIPPGRAGRICKNCRGKIA